METSFKEEKLSQSRLREKSQGFINHKMADLKFLFGDIE